MTLEQLLKKIESYFERSLCVPGYFHFYQDNCVAASVRCNPKTGYWIASLDGKKLKKSLYPEESLKTLLQQLEANGEFKSIQKSDDSFTIHHYD